MKSPDAPGVVPVLSLEARIEKVEEQLRQWEPIFGEESQPVKVGRWIVAEFREALDEGLDAWCRTGEAAARSGWARSTLQANAVRIADGEPPRGWESTDVRREGHDYWWRLASIPIRLPAAG